MGAGESIYRWDRDPERSRPLPSSCHDLHWRIVGFSHLFDSDYLNKKEAGSEEVLAASIDGRQSSPPTGGSVLPDKGVSFEEHCRDEALDLADSSTILLDLSDAGGDAVSKRLLGELVVACRGSERFSRVIAQRMHMLACAHHAWRRSYERQCKAISQLTSSEKDGFSPRQSVQLPRDVSLGIDLLFSLLDLGRDQPEHSREFLHEICPALCELPPLCLASDGSAVARGGLFRHLWRRPFEDVKRTCWSIWVTGDDRGKILDRLRDFLYRASMPAQADVDEQMREGVLTALMGLVAAAGRAKDLLLLIKLLLRVGQPRVTQASYGGGEGFAGCVECDAPETETEEEYQQANQTVNETRAADIRAVQAKTRLLSRKVPQRRMRSFRMGNVMLEVDGCSDEDDAALLNLEDGPAAEHIAGTERQPSGLTKLMKPCRPVVELRKSPPTSSTQRPWQQQYQQQQHQRDLPNVSLLPDTQEPVVKAQSKRASVCKLPPTVLPFLRQLSAAEATCSPARQADSRGGQQREVWTCGQNSYGELAHGDTASRKVHALAEACQGRDIVGIAAGNEHTVLLTRSGDVYTAGYNDNGQCGVGGTQRVSQLALVDKLVGKGASQVHAFNGCEHTLVVLADGRLASFGYNYRGQLGQGTTISEPVPRLVRGLEGKRVMLVSCSYYHSMVACESGEVYTFGRNDYGQLGHGDTVDKKVPQAVESLRGQSPASLACGQYHSMVATRDGKLFSCGKNDYGQLGLESSEGHKHMTAVSSPVLHKQAVTEVRCGYYHSIVLCDGGHVFSFGRGDYGQLGLGHIAQRVHGPQLIEAVEGKGITRIAAGCYHSVFVGRNGMLYVCGRNNWGQLGTGDTNERHFPHPIDLFLGKRVAMVAAGFYHTIVLTGGVEDDSSHASGASECAALSPACLLGLSSFTMPPIDCVTSASEGLLQPAAPADWWTHKTVTSGDGMAGVSSTHDVRPDCVITEKMRAPDDPRGGVIREDGWSESPLKLAMAETDKPNGERWLCDKDGVVASQKAAVYLLAQMDRLAFNSGTRGASPSSLDAKALENLRAAKDGTEGHLGHPIYYGDASPETFELLWCLLNHLCDNEPSVLFDDDVDLGSDSVSFIHSYCILACLRIVRANLVQLLSEPSTRRLRDMLCCLKRSGDGLDDVDDDSSVVSALHGHAADLLRSEILIGLSESGAERPSGAPSKAQTSDASVKRMSNVICALHHQLLEMVQRPSSVADPEALSAIQSEAGRLLILGLELFYPSPAQQCQLLSDLVSCCGSGMDSPVSGLTAQGILLKPLLERLVSVDNDLTQALVIPVTPIDDAANGHVVVSMLDLLVQRLLQIHFDTGAGCGFVRDLGFARDPACSEQTASGPAVAGAGELHRDVCHVEHNADLVTQVVLIIQKHIMNWAANHGPPAVAEISSHRSAQECVTSERSRGRSLIESVAESSGKYELHASWKCLLEYVQSTLRQSMDALMQLPGLLEERQMRAATAPELQIISSEDLAVIERSMIGAVLPSLVTGLLHFAYIPFFALQLMPLVTDFYRLLNRIAVALPEVMSIDNTYVRRRAADSPVLPHNGITLNAAISPLNASMQSSIRARRRSTAAQLDGPCVDAANLPPLYCLIKSLGYLASRLAGTLTIGQGDSQSEITALKVRPHCARWLSSPLLRGGLEPSCTESFGRPCVATPTQRRPKAPAQNIRGPSTHMSQAERTTGTGPTSSQIASFLESIALGQQSPARDADIVDVLRKAYMARDPAYATLRRQADQTSEKAAIEALERATCATIMKHEGLGLDAYLRCAALRIGQCSASQTAPMRRRLMHVWKAVAEVFMSVWRRRNDLRSKDRESGDALTRAMVQAMHDGASVLLCFGRDGPAATSLLHVLGAQHVPVSIMERRRPWAHKLRRAMLLVRALIRWRSMVRVTLGPGKDVVKFLQDLCEHHCGKSSSALESLVRVAVDNHRRALVRDLGLRSFRSLLSSTKLPSVMHEVLHALGPALRDPATTAGHYLIGLDAVGDRLHRQVQRSFQSLYEDMCQRMAEMSSVQCNDATSDNSVLGSSPHAHENASNYGTNKQWDVSLLLMLIDAWGLKFRERDWSFVVNVGLLQVLQNVIKGMTGSLSPEDEPLSSDGVNKEGRLGRRSPSNALNRRGSRLLSSSMVKDRERQLKQCINAGWLLMRLMVSQIPGVATDEETVRSAQLCRLAWAEMLQPVFHALHDEARHSMERLRRFTEAPLLMSCRDGQWQSLQPTDTSSAQTAQDPTSAEKSGPLGAASQFSMICAPSNTQRKRCQELISGPRRFMNMEDGIVFPSEHLLTNPGRGTDFSMSFWFYLTQDLTGKYRTILTRGYKAERWPVIMLRDIDRRIEVGFGLSSMATLCERLTSKDPVPLSKWVHICLVSEGNKLRLYMNGALDYQRSNMGVPREYKHPLYVGKVPEGTVRLQGVKGGFEGSISSLRYYNRALSPIHVRVVCDQGPPELVHVKDRKCFQICSLLALASRSPVALPHLCSRQWLNVLLQYLKHGTNRVQQATVRILTNLLPHVSPATFSSLSMGEPAIPPAVDQPASGVRYLLRLIGLGLSRMRIDAVLRTYSLLKEDEAQAPETASTLDAAINSPAVFARFMPSCIALCCVCEGVPAAPCTPEEERSSVSTPPHRTLSSEVVQDTSALSLELIMMLQRLLCCPAWQSTISSVLAAALQGLRGACNGTQAPALVVTDEQRFRSAEGLAALYVVGAYKDTVRVGSSAIVRGTDVSGVIIGYDEVACVAQLVLSGHDQGGAALLAAKVHRRLSQQVELPVELPCRVVRVNADDLVVLADTEAMQKMSGETSVVPGMEVSAKCVMDIWLHLVECEGAATWAACKPFKTTGTDPRMDPSALLSPIDACMGDTAAEVSMCRDEEVPSLKDVQVACVRSLCVTFICEKASNEELLKSLVHSGGSTLLQSLIMLAIQPDRASDFMTLEEAEMRALLIRRRLTQVMAPDADCGPWSSLRQRTDADAAEGDGTLRHVGTSILNCPACLVRLPGGLRHDGVAPDEERDRREEADTYDADDQVDPTDTALRSRSSTTDDIEALRNLLTEAPDDDGENEVDPSRSHRPSCRTSSTASSNNSEEAEASVPADLQSQLVTMGFPEEWCALALRENNNDIINASSWIVDNLDMLTKLSELQKDANGEQGQRERDEQDDEGDEQNDVDWMTPSRRRTTVNDDYEHNQGASRASNQPNEQDDLDNAARHAHESFAELLDGEEGEAMDNQSPESGRSLTEDDYGTGRRDSLEDETYEASDNGGDPPCQGPYSRHKGSADSAQSTGSKFSLLEDRDQFSEECAADAYIESYFPSTLHEPGRNSSPTPSSAARRDSNVTNKRQVQAKVIMGEIAALDPKQLLLTALRMETTLAMLYARATVVKILASWPEDQELTAQQIGHHHVVLQLIKVLLFRGCQLPNLRLTRQGKGVAEGFGDNEGAEAHKGVLTIMGKVLVRMLQAEMQTSTKTSLPETLLGPPVNADDQQTLGSLLTSCCLDELEAAALIGAFSEVHWGYRDIRMTDSLALLQPNVELAFWLLDHLLYMKHPHVFTVTVFTRLCNCLRSANLTLKETVFKVLTRIFVRWVTILQQNRPSLQAEATAEDRHNGAHARLAVIRDALRRHLSFSRILATVNRRVAFERRQDRVFFSAYVCSAMNFVIALSKLQEVLGELSDSSAQAILPLSSAAPGDILTMERIPTAEFLSPPPQLGAPTVSQTTDTSLLVRWQEIPWSDGSAPSSAVSSIFELEVSDRAVQRNAIGRTGRHEEKSKEDDEVQGSEDGFRSLYRGPALQFCMEGIYAFRTYNFRVRAATSASGREGTAGRWSDFTTIQTKAVAPFTFDKLKCGPTVFLSRDGMSASFAASETWSTVLGSTGFLCGRNSWEVHIDKSPTAYLFIGVATQHTDLTTFLGGDDYGWGYIGDRALYSKRAKVRAYGQRFGEGDTIGLVLDMDRGTLSFTKNGVDLGVAFEGITGEVYPAVAFYNQGQRVSLVRSSFNCPGAGVTIPGSPTSVGVGEVMEVSDIMSCMLTRQPLAPVITREAYQRFLAWEAGTTFRCNTVCRYQLQLDTSPEACRPFGFKSGDRVRTARGNATMMGVADGKPWFQVDEEHGVWFFSMVAIREGRTKGFFTPTSSAARPPSGLVDDAEGALEAGAKALQPSRSRPVKLCATPANKTQCTSGSGPEPLNLETFTELSDARRWTAAMDALLVRAVNEFCQRKQLSPWNLTVRVILACAASVRSELMSLAQEADHHAAGGIALWTSDADGREVDNLSDLAILCRFAVLRMFNDRLAHTLPFFGCGDGVPSVYACAPMLSVWGTPGEETQGMAAGEDPRSFVKPSTLLECGAGRGLGPMLCAIRASVFSATKERALKAVIDRTATPLKKAEDDYDYPDDLPQIMVNRPKAFHTRGNPDPDARLAMSLIGQLFGELRFRDVSQLRIGYSHPMDDGQQRTFKIRFEGEGVDDYGGPYRETFTLVTDEVQAVSPSSKLMDGLQHCLLPLLRPTPNSISEAETGDSFQLMPQPKRTRHCDLEFYSFLGQLMGIAVRSRVYTRFKFPPVLWKALVAEPLTDADLATVDKGVYSFIKKTRKLLKAASARVGSVSRARLCEAAAGQRELAQAMYGLTWTAQLSDETEVELRPRGRNVAVPVEEAEEYLQALLKCRLHENHHGLRAMRHGFASIVPPVVLPLLNWYELEAIVTGRKAINIDLLQSNTEYDDDVSPDDAHIKMLWEVLREFDEDEVVQFLRFVWARPSLPASAEDFQQKFKIQAAVGDSSKDNPDRCLPKAHTCFFSLNLPRYSSKDVMAEKLRYAMKNCVEMDADFRLAENEMTGWDFDP